VVFAGGLASTPAAASDWERLLDNEYTKVSLDLRARVELAKVDGDESSQAYTIRPRLGIGTKPWHGLTAYVEGESTLAIDSHLYWDVASTPNGHSAIADPEVTELNQLFLRYENPALLGAHLTAGRQRLVLDDQRFIGNVGWRQNEQTFDAVWTKTSLGVEDLALGYGYLWEIHRIYGDKGDADTQDYDSDSHLLHLSYQGWDVGTLAVFAYLLDFENSPANSADSVGFRLTGEQPLGPFGPDWSLGYAGSYAFQSDAGDNPVSYSASYVAAEASLRHAGLGALSLGYELLGSDDGDAVFTTPLATLHKFDGFADTFLDNGGPNGLQDLYLTLAPSLPWQLQGQLILHRFWSDEGSEHLGDEVDVVVSRAFGDRVTVLTKGAWFDGTSDGPADRWRFWLELTFRY
jgi:hypothetical protein